MQRLVVVWMRFYVRGKRPGSGEIGCVAERVILTKQTWQARSGGLRS